MSHLGRTMGGRGLIQIAKLHDRVICGIEKKLQSRSNPLLMEARKITRDRIMPRMVETTVHELHLTGPELPNKHIISAAQQDQMVDQVRLIQKLFMVHTGWRFTVHMWTMTLAIIG